MAFSVSQLSPFGPIFGKELRTTARRKRTYWLRFIYLALLFVFLLAGYTSVSSRRYGVGASVAERARAEAELGTLFFTIFAYFSVLAMPLISPILTATAISAERLGKTLNVLLMTPITSWQIVSGKLFSRLLIALSLLALSLPVLAVVRLLGGVDLDAMLAALCLCASVALAGAALGLFFSTRINRAYAVILMSYGTMFVLYAIIPYIYGLSLNSGGRAGRASEINLFRFLGVTNPVFSISTMVFNVRRMRLPIPDWWWCATFHVVCAAILVLWTGRTLRRKVMREGEAAAVIPNLPVFEPAVATASEVDQATTVSTHRLRGTRDVGDNPVLWREVRRPLMAKRWQAVVGGMLCVGLLLLTYVLLANQFENQLNSVDVHVGYSVVFYTVMLLLTCVLAGTAIAGEKESDTWSLLLATPLRGGEIVRGKVAGIARRMIWPLGLFVAHLFVFAVAGVLSWTAVCCVIWVTVSFTSVWLACGVGFSLKLRNNTFAVVMSLAMPVCAYVLVPVVLLIVGNLVLDRRPERMANSVCYYLPYIYIGNAVFGLPGAKDWSWQAESSRLEFPNSHEPLTPAAFICIAIVVGLIHVAVAAIILVRLSRRFDRTVARAPQLAAVPPMPATLRS